MKHLKPVLSTLLLATIATTLFAFGPYKKSSYIDHNSYKLSPTSISSMQATVADKGITESGLFLHYNPYLPSKKYGWLKSATIWVNGDVLDQASVDDYRDDVMEIGKFGFGHGLELGSMFRLVDYDPIAIGLRLTWIDFGFSMFKASNKYSAYAIKGFAIDVRAIKIGPYFTYAITDQMAVDVFYQLTPTFIVGGMAGSYAGDDVGYGIMQYGLSHETGFTYRFDMLSIGCGYSFGSLYTNFTVPVDGDSYKIKGRSYAGNFRIMAGMKF